MAEPENKNPTKPNPPSDDAVATGEDSADGRFSDKEINDTSPVGNDDIDALLKQAGATGGDSAEAKAFSDEEINDTSPVGNDDIEALLNQASENLEKVVGNDVSPQAQPFALNDLAPNADANDAQPIELLSDVEMDLRVELGRTQMRLEDVLQLRSGSVVALDKLAGDPVDIFVNGKLIARGEVLVMNDNFCIRVTELVGV